MLEKKKIKNPYEEDNIFTANEENIRIVNGQIIEIDRVCRTAEELEEYRREILREMDVAEKRHAIRLRKIRKI